MDSEFKEYLVTLGLLAFLFVFSLGYAFCSGQPGDWVPVIGYALIFISCLTVFGNDHSER